MTHPIDEFTNRVLMKQVRQLRRQVDELRQEMEALLMIVEGGYPAALVAKAVEQARDALARQEVTE